MLIIGLTGSIAMGKSTLARQFRRLGVPVFDADAQVQTLLNPDSPALPQLKKAFPEAFPKGSFDKKALTRKVFAEPAALLKLEALLHPMIRQAEHRFLQRCMRERRKLVLLDIPLLFETGADQLCDLTITVTAPAWLQRKRALARPGMTEERLRATLARQLPDREKRRLADTIIHTSLGRAYSFRQAQKLIRTLHKNTSQ